MRHLERKVESDLKTSITALSFELGVKIYYLKLSILGFRGWPDRLILWPGRGILFVELKRDGEEPRNLQVEIHDSLRKLGFDVEVYDNEQHAFREISQKIRASLGAASRNETNRKRTGE